MPLKSKAQAAYLKDHDPEVFEKFKAMTPKGTKLPLRVGKLPLGQRPKGGR